VYGNIVALPPNHSCHEKAVSLKHNECVCVLALVMRHADSVFSAQQYTVLSSVACLALPQLSILFHKGRIFGKSIGNKMCILIFSTTFV
jgi:hypothetical protein